MGKQRSVSMPPENMVFQIARLFKVLSIVFMNIRPVCMGSDMSILVGLFEYFATNSAYILSPFLTMSRDVPHEFPMTGKGMMTEYTSALTTVACSHGS